MEQGKDVYENQPIPVAPGEIDGVLATHAHICLLYTSFCSMGPLVKSPVRVFCVMKMLCLLKYQMVLTKKRAAQQRATQIVL